MRSKAVALGHPIHPMLIPFPIAFLTGAVVFDAAGWLFEKLSWWATGGYLAVAGIVTALAAAVPGLIDYLYTVPPNSSGKTRATRHLLANIVAVSLFVAALVVRGELAGRPHVGVVGIELLGMMLLTVGGYLGGTLVTRNLISVDHRYADAGKWREETVAPDERNGVIVAKRDELKVDQMKLLRASDKRIVLARTEQGYVAFDDRCTHRGGSLAGGVMLCGTVQCLWHGSRFDVHRGSVKGGPAETPIAVYRLTEDAEGVKLFL